MRRENSSKSSLNSGSLIFFWIGANSKPFSSVLISAFDRTLWLRLKILSDQKCPLKWPKFFILTSCSLALSTLPNSSRISSNWGSCVSRASKSSDFLKELEELLTIDGLLIILGGDVAILKELSFSSVINKDIATTAVFLSPGINKNGRETFRKLKCCLIALFSIKLFNTT